MTVRVNGKKHKNCDLGKDRTANLQNSGWFR